jgi:hypothetical protein
MSQSSNKHSTPYLLLLMIDVVGSSETSINFYEAKGLHIPEDINLH